MRTSLLRLTTFGAAALLTLNFAACSDDVVDICEENPDAEGCETVDPCEENPDAEGCDTTPIDCTEEALEAVMLEQLDVRDTLAENIPEVSVEEIDEIDGDPIEGYRILSFNLPTSAQPGNTTEGNTPTDTSKLYLDFDTNKFLEITDEDALTNTEWDIAFDGKMLNYLYANSGHSGGFTEDWPAGMMLAKLEDIESAEDLIAVDASDQDALPYAVEQWIDPETCEPTLTNWLPVLQLKPILPKTIAGRWYVYNGETHGMDTPPVAYAVYNAADNHHVYKFQFLEYDPNSLLVRIAVHEQVLDIP